ncbi:hypothetical protein RP75_27730 [Agrobacterium arsenijevicii]|uniref:Uncharacterized protein n=1 Tax=Agrobacterium arsenijevicii TaxID=1585697 RepID=A0ABR5D029_9HYPH|nr:hypothetical protein RP75_27730 [Agrobacterium arsenijevicii]
MSFAIPTAFEKVASEVLVLATDEKSDLTGQMIMIDGGRQLSSPTASWAGSVTQHASIFEDSRRRIDVKQSGRTDIDRHHLKFAIDNQLTSPDIAFQGNQIFIEHLGE